MQAEGTTCIIICTPQYTTNINFVYNSDSLAHPVCGLTLALSVCIIL